MKLVVDFLVNAAYKQHLRLPRANSQMRKLRQVVAKYNGLHKGRRNLFRTVRLINEQDHVLVVVVDFEAVVDLLDVEHTASRFVWADDDIGRQFKRLAHPLAEIVEAFRQLENEVESDKTL